MYFYCKAFEKFTEFLLYEFLKKWNMEISLDFILDNVILKYNHVIYKGHLPCDEKY